MAVNEARELLDELLSENCCGLTKSDKNVSPNTCVQVGLRFHCCFSPFDERLPNVLNYRALLNLFCSGLPSNRCRFVGIAQEAP
jgi:hypothetical protein